MELAIRWYHRRTAILRLKKAIHRLADRDHESALIEDSYDSTWKLLGLATFRLEFRDCSRCGRASTRRVSNQKHIFSFSDNKPIQEIVNGGSIVDRLRIAAKGWISIIVWMEWITNIELGQVRGG